MESLEVVQARIREAVPPARAATVAVRDALGLVLYAKWLVECWNATLSWPCAPWRN